MRFLVLKSDGKLVKGTVHDKKEIKAANYYKFLLSKGIITENEEEIEKYLNDVKETVNKYSKIENKKFKYEISLGSNDDNISISTSDILSALTRKLDLKANLKPIDKTVDLSLNDINKSSYKEIKLVGDDDYKLSIFIRFNEKPLKGKAKRLGLKSVFVKENELVLTTFSKNDDVVIEKVIIDNDINNVRNVLTPENYSVRDVNNKKITLSNNRLSAEIDNPSYSKNSDGTIVRMDYLQRKPTIEKQYFNREFNDNIHIQLAYNIMDIKKIFGLYVNEVIFTMENLAREYDGNSKDLVGNTNPYYSWDRANDKSKNQFNPYFEKVDKYLKYFAGAYSSGAFNKDSEEKTTNRDNRKVETYNILRILSMFRQFSMHSNADLYNLESNRNFQDLISIINERYNSVYNNLVNSTIKASKNNIELIFEILGLNKNDNNVKKEILNEYFKFVINKSSNNMGFRFITLKEALIKKLGITVADDSKRDTYMVINFIIYKKLTEKPEVIDKYVKALLACEKTTDKDDIYDKFASEIKDEFSGIITDKWVNYNKGKDKSTFSIDKSLLNAPTSSNDAFYKAVYFLTIFLDTKEINMLVTSLINKFNNIKGFVNVLENNTELKTEYSMFSNRDKLEEIISSLNVVLNIARMQKNFNKKFKNDKNDSANTVSGEMLYDAYSLFGYDGNRETFNDDTKSDREQVKGKRIAKFQNKIGSAIANSNQFRYIIKYANPRDCYKIMRNTNIIQFVLNEIPQTQIDKYLDGKYEGAPKSEKIRLLSEELSSLHIDQMRQSYDKNDANSDANQMKLPKLYMTVIFQIIKQMVRINAYYNIAFSCYERDRSLYNIPKEYLDYSDLVLVEAFSKGVSEFDLSETPKVGEPTINHISIDAPTNTYKRKVDGVIVECTGPKLGSSKYSWIKDNIDSFKDIFYKQNKHKTTEIETCNMVYRNTFRNKIAHLNVISSLGDIINDFCTSSKKMNSYYELYQYAIQKVFLKEFERGHNQFTDFLTKCKNEIEETKTYSRNLLHILNMPFAYNMARYKNLTIEDIFYDKFDNKIKAEKE